jgi:serine protease
MKYLLFLVIFSFNIFAQEYYENTIVIKLKNNSQELKEIYEIKETSSFGHYFKDYSIEYFVDERLLDIIDNKHNSSYSFRNYQSENQLRRIFVIRYTNDYDPLIISRKLSRLGFVEYAEPLYKHYLTDFPNDLDYDRLYHIPQVKADSAWTISDSLNKVILAIVDTGVDYLHDDLKKNIYVNSGEYGIDDNGNEKAVNGIDDDGNGFTDDWRGWDFAAGDSLLQDNNPAPGNSHGTHVAGTAAAVINNLKGVAGVANNALIMPVKIGPDDPNSRSTFNSYDGLLYAAVSGADVINCSWGSTGFSQAEKDVIAEALKFDCLIVAAAGNNGIDGVHYPASYDGVLSVAAVDSNDRRAYFSNFNYTVDVSAPGVDIFSTIPNSIYTRMSGTSMASPVVAGVAAMVRGSYKDDNYLQSLERIKATSDNIDSINNSYIAKLGTGRVNAFEALRKTNPKSIYVKDIDIMGNIPDAEFSTGENININLDIINYLSDIENLSVKVFEQYGNEKYYVKDIPYGEFKKNEEGVISDIQFNLPDNTPYNYRYYILFDFYDGDEYINSYGNSIIMNNSYKTFDVNNLTVTATSQGNICFNDYPDNEQGVGFRYKNSANLSYEGALIVARDTFKISNVARGSAQIAKNRAFEVVKNMNKTISDNSQNGFAAMTDNPNDTNHAGFKILTHINQFDDEMLKDIIFVSYDLINYDDFYKDSVFAGLYFDWDIAPDVHMNKIYYNEEYETGMCINTETDTVPLAAVRIISDNPVNFFAIDNPGDTEDNPGVYDGFTYAEKWRALSSGIARKESNVTDASMVMSAGPLTFMPGDTIRVTFALFAGDSENQILQTSQIIDDYAVNFLKPDGNFATEPTADNIKILYPNPSYDGNINVEFEIREETKLTIDIVDLTGKKITTIIRDKNYFKGKYSLNANISEYANGVYFIRFISGDNIKQKKLILTR